MTGAVPLPASATPPVDRLAELLAESTTALSRDARSAARLAAEATALATAAADIGARARARYLEGRAAALDDRGDRDGGTQCTRFAHRTISPRLAADAASRTPS